MYGFSEEKEEREIEKFEFSLVKKNGGIYSGVSRILLYFYGDFKYMVVLSKGGILYHLCYIISYHTITNLYRISIMVQYISIIVHTGGQWYAIPYHIENVNLAR